MSDIYRLAEEKIEKLTAELNEVLGRAEQIAEALRAYMIVVNRNVESKDPMREVEEVKRFCNLPETEDL